MRAPDYETVSTVPEETADETPPLVDRLLWREGIDREKLISHDRGLMARTFGTLYLIGGMVGWLLLAVGEAGGREDGVIAAITTAAFVLGCVCFVGYRRLPMGFFAAMLVLGTLMVSGATVASTPGAEPIFGFFYVWIVFAAFLFFSVPVAIAQVTFAAICFAVVLFARDTPFAINALIAGSATMGTAGAIMGLLMNRIEGIAAVYASEARTDPVTEIANRRDFDQRFRLELERARRTGRPLSLLICDLDRFKAVNDALGHEEGDVALRRAAASISDSVRQFDIVTRLGGEEFGEILPNTGPRAGAQVADRIRGAIRDEFATYEVRLTASCGLASTTAAGTDPDAVYRGADVALYTAKRDGRDRTAVFERD